VFLCELFADEAAVKHHNDTPHLRTFRPTVAPMIVSRRLQSWSLVAST
jgi:quinol monooxygenase YgiN